MHEIRITMPPDCVPVAVRLAQDSGISEISVAPIYVHGPEAHRRVVSVETSTPKARAFVTGFYQSNVLSAADCTLTSRELRAIVSRENVSDLTQPMSEPFTDIIQDLWQLSHVTASYAGRAAAGAILLATGIIENNSVAIVVAALFLPFLSQVLAVSFGAWKDRKLARQGLTALMVSTFLALASGALVALIEGGPIRYEGFKSPLVSLAISGLIGATAGLSIGDDTGRRYLIGVAAAVQFAIFPVWFGAALVLGLPEHEQLYPRLLSFLVNLFAISGTALVAYSAAHPQWKERGAGSS